MYTLSLYVYCSRSHYSNKMGLQYSYNLFLIYSSCFLQFYEPLFDILLLISSNVFLYKHTY